MNTDIFLSFLVSNVGFFIFFRRITHQIAVYGTKISARWIFNIGATIFCLLFWFSSDFPLILAGFIGVIIFFLTVLPTVFRTHSEKKFIENLPEDLEMLVIGMKTGHSIKNSAEMMTECCTKDAKKIWQTIFLDIELDQESKFLHQSLRELVFDLKSLQNQKVKVVESLLALQKHHATVKFFRHRSRQASLQSKVQTNMLAIFFILAVLYQIVYRPQPHWTLLFIAAAIFVTGLLFTLYIGRFKKWKI